MANNPSEPPQTLKCRINSCNGKVKKGSPNGFCFKCLKKRKDGWKCCNVITEDDRGNIVEIRLEFYNIIKY